MRDWYVQEEQDSKEHRAYANRREKLADVRGVHPLPQHKQRKRNAGACNEHAVIAGSDRANG